MEAADNKISVLIPVYNEDEKILAETIKKIESLLKNTSYKFFEIIVIDDGSTTPLNNANLNSGNTKLISHEHNLGYGAALKNGLRASDGNIIIIIDADGTYPVEAIPEMLDKIKSADMVVGARTGQIVEVPFIRQPAKWLLKKIANYLAGEKIPDLNSGLRIFKKDAAMQFFHLYPQGFSFTTTLTLAFISDNLIVKYIPINYYKREASKSKIRPITDTKNILITILRTIIYFDPLKICLPAGLTFLTAAFLLFILTLSLQISKQITNLPDGTISVLALTGIQIIIIGLLADLIIRRSGK